MCLCRFGIRRIVCVPPTCLLTQFNGALYLFWPIIKRSFRTFARSLGLHPGPPARNLDPPPAFADHRHSTHFPPSPKCTYCLANRRSVECRRVLNNGESCCVSNGIMHHSHTCPRAAMCVCIVCKCTYICARLPLLLRHATTTPVLRHHRVRRGVVFSGRGSVRTRRITQ